MTVIRLGRLNQAAGDKASSSPIGLSRDRILQSRRYIAEIATVIYCNNIPGGEVKLCESL